LWNGHEHLLFAKHQGRGIVSRDFEFMGGILSERDG
jgi:hypothetical protein